MTMYKAKLHELCQQMRFENPKYSFTKDGPKHDLRFKASVIVNDIKFEMKTTCSSSKRAFNEAAKLAVIHFTSGLEQVSDDEEAVESPRVQSNTSGTKNDKSSETVVSSSTSSEGQIAKVCNPQGDSKPDFPSRVKQRKGEDEERRFIESLPHLSCRLISEIKTYLARNSVRVYTSIPDFELPYGTVLIPIAENKWVVVNLKFTD